MKKPNMIAVIVLVAVNISLSFIQWIQAKKQGQQMDSLKIQYGR